MRPDFERVSVQEFQEACRERLGPMLEAHRFELVGGYSRPPGLSIEYARDEDRLIAACEGGVIHLEMLLSRDEDLFYRVDLNQMLWFKGVRKLARSKAGWREKLEIFVAELETHEPEAFSPDLETMDSRYCFPMTRELADDYLSYHRA